MRPIPATEDPRLGVDVSDRAITAAIKEQDKTPTPFERMAKAYPAMDGEKAAVDAGVLGPRPAPITHRLAEFRESDELAKLKELEATVNNTDTVTPHEPSDASRAIVSELLFVNPVERVARIMNISESTLRKYYAWEIEEGGALQMGALANSAIRRAQAGDTTLTIFLLKTKGGMREKPIEKEIEDTASKLTDAERSAMFARILMALDKSAPKAT